MRVIRNLLALLVLAIPATMVAQMGIAVSIGPPELPVYEQPLCPADGYLWTPGYWAYDDSVSDYYWVPGTWVEAPEMGFLWTPGYWGWRDSGYFFNEGYWGPEIGFYGGINYGYGYFGEGYRGGRWDHDHFFYNRTVNHLDITINRNVYNEDVDRGREDRRISYHGGTGGIDARPTPREEAAAHQRHVPAVAVQADHERAARSNPEQRAGVNHGKPAVAATAKPGDFSEQHGAVRAKEAIEPTKAEPAKSVEPARTEAPAKAAEPTRHEAGAAPAEPRVAAHPKELPPIARPEPVNSGNAKADKQYQQRQETLIARQTAEREKLQQQQEAEHQRKANANAQQLEQKHQQQTQKLVQKHTAQQQTLQARQPQPRPAKPEPKK